MNFDVNKDVGQGGGCHKLLYFTEDVHGGEDSYILCKGRQMGWNYKPLYHKTREVIACVLSLIKCHATPVCNRQWDQAAVAANAKSSLPSLFLRHILIH